MLQLLHERCKRLEDKHMGGLGSADPAIMDRMHSDMEGLLVKVSDISWSNDELMTPNDSDLVMQPGHPSQGLHAQIRAGQDRDLEPQRCALVLMHSRQLTRVPHSYLTDLPADAQV